MTTIGLGRSVSVAFLLRLARVGQTYVLHVLLGRWLGVSAYGALAFTLAWVQVGASLAPAGFDTAVLRLIPRYRVQEERPLLGSALEFSSRLTLGLSALVAVVFAVGVWCVRGDSLGLLFVGVLLLPVLALGNLRVAQVRGFDLVYPALAPRSLYEPLTTMLVLAILVVSGQPASAEFGLGAILLGATAALLLLGRALTRVAGAAGAMWGKARPKVWKTWVTLSLPMLMTSASLIVLDRIDVLVVGILLGDAQAGIYSAASRIALFVGFGLVAVNVVMAPVIAGAHAARELAELQVRLDETRKLIPLLVLPVVMGLGVGGEWILGLFGPEFRTGYPALLLLMGGQLVNALSGVVGILLAMTGHQRVVAQVMGTAAVVNAVLNLSLVPMFGIVGAAAATASTIAIQNLILVRFVRRRLQLRVTAVGL